MRRKPQTIFLCLILSILFFGGLESLALADLSYSLSPGSGSSWTYDVDITNTTRAELVFMADMTFASGLTISSYTNPWETVTNITWTTSTSASPNNSNLSNFNGQATLALYANL